MTQPKRKVDAMQRFRYQIIERIAVLGQSGDTTKELNLISFNGFPAKYDLRSWQRADGAETMLKGVTLTAEEAARLRDVLIARDDL